MLEPYDKKMDDRATEELEREGMMEYIITDNSAGQLVLLWDDERFALFLRDKLLQNGNRRLVKAVVILNPREAKEISNAIKETLGGKK